MKKYLLILTLSLAACMTNAQNCVTNSPILMGKSDNVFGVAFGTRTNLWYDKDINTLSFMHRDTASGTVVYDYSANQGVTWSVKQGPVYNGTSGSGRFPQGVIYNPSGNTTPTNAYVNAFGPTNGVTDYEGTSQLGTTTNKQQTFTVSDGTPQGMQIVKNTGTVWVAAEGVDNVGNYDDSIVMGKGTYSNGDFNYDFSKTFYAFSNQFADISTAWSDDGMIGYVVMLGNNMSPWVDSAYYPIVYKTEYGGDQWQQITCRGENLDIDQLSLVLGTTKRTMTTAFDVDCAMDKNNNLHIAVDVGYYDYGGSILTAPGEHGVFDLYTTDGGCTWYGELMDKPETFRGSFGITGSMTDPPVDEDNRPAVTRSWDGSKIFISWFDTDTINFPAVGNTNPDWHLRGYDINTQNTTNLWTVPVDMTDTLTSSYGFCTFSNLSYYSVIHGSDEWVPMVYAQLATPVSTGSPLTFRYVDGACVKSNAYSVTGSPVLLDGSGVCALFVGCLAGGINELENSSFTVSANYPNPFNSSTMVDVMLNKSADVTIEVSNIVGQVLSTKTYRNLSVGKNQVTIEAGDIAAGLYIFKVKVGGEVVTRTMSVE